MMMVTSSGGVEKPARCIMPHARATAYACDPIFEKSDRQIVSQIVRHESEFLIRRQLPVHGTMYKKALNTVK